MLVTWPAVLLLLDYWPLRRIEWQPGFWRRFCVLAGEKLPLVALALVSSIVTFFVQRQGGAMTAWDVIPLPTRMFGAVLAYAVYLYKTFWPTSLCILYEYWNLSPVQFGSGFKIVIPGAPWQLLMACAALATFTALALWQRQKRPYILVGWLWYLGILVPVIGVVQVGEQAYADRYTYLPLIGIFWIVVWLAAELIDGLGARLLAARRWIAAAIVAGAALSALAVITDGQLRHWKNSKSVFLQAVQVDPTNAMALNNLGSAYYDDKDMEKAEACFRQAIEHRPDDVEALVNLAGVLTFQGRLTEAELRVRRALAIDGNSAEAHFRFANIMRQDRPAQAIAEYQRAIELSPRYAEAHNNLGVLLARRSPEAAERHYRQAIEYEPRNADAHANLGALLARKGDLQEAAKHFQDALRFNPNHRAASAGLRWLEERLRGKTP